MGNPSSAIYSNKKKSDFLMSYIVHYLCQFESKKKRVKSFRSSFSLLRIMTKKHFQFHDIMSH